MPSRFRRRTDAVSFSLILEMAAGAMPDRIAIGSHEGGRTYGDLAARVAAAATLFQRMGATCVALIDVNSDAVPVALFASAAAGVPFAPLNYRLPDDQLAQLVDRLSPVVVIADAGVAARVGDGEGRHLMTPAELLRLSLDDSPAPLGESSDDIGVLLFTSGTTGAPKAAVLRHANLVAYILGSLEFMGAGDDEATLVSVPPYHIAGISAILSSTYVGRRIVYLHNFEPSLWVDTVRAEGITHAMVVPTMLTRILDNLDERSLTLPSLRSLSYGGGPMPASVIVRALEMLPDVGFVNAYGLTETASTVCVLGPDDHRISLSSEDPVVRRRLHSVGRPIPTIELSIRDPFGEPLGAGERGEIWVRGDQVSGEYVGTKSAGDGWFHTRDEGEQDDDGYVYVFGRLDDVIVRGGENLSPGEIEAVLVSHPAVIDAAVVGIPDSEWGQSVVAAVVCSADAPSEDELRAFVRARLRSTKTPERIQFRDHLPVNETGKLLRRVLREQLTELELP
jgi:fatty-acyl-CoA synthase